MAAEDNDHTARVSSLTGALRSLERKPEPDRAPDSANLPLIRDPLPSLDLFASEQPVTEPPDVPADSALRRLSTVVQANRRLLVGACVALVVIVAAGAGVRRLWPRLRASRSSAPAAVATAPAPTTTADAAAPPATAAPADAPPETSTTAASTAHDVQLPPEPRRRKRSEPVGVAVGADAPVTAASTVAESTAAPVLEFRPVSPVAEPSSSSPLEPTNVTFSSSDAGVTPPKAIDAQTLIKLRPVTPGIRHDALIIAVVVNEDGLVESARAVMPPRDLGESVILMGALSSAKSWRFHPATRSGQPVKFRQTFELADTSER